MEKNNSTNEKNTNYEIEFIDPDDLIDFIADEKLNIDKVEIPEATSVPASSELKYTELLKESSGDYVKKRREDTRGRLALVYTIFTFLMFIIVIFVGVLDGLIRQVSIVQNLSTLLPLVSGIFLGTLGFVLGYYFKREDNHNG